MRPLLVLLGLALASCGGADDPRDAVTGDSPPTRLVVEQTSGGETSTWTLTCDPPGGDHPDPEAACADLDALARQGDPFAPLPEDRICTEQYGGDQTARITGTFRGAPVDVALSRIDGCRIAQWDGFGAVLPGPVGVDDLPE
jgi:hypothetical protein